MLHVLIIFIIYQTVHFFPNKYKALPTLNFAKTSKIIVKPRKFQAFDAYFDP